MTNIKGWLKRLWFSICPTFRQTTYLLGMVSKLEDQLSDSNAKQTNSSSRLEAVCTEILTQIQQQNAASSQSSEKLLKLEETDEQIIRRLQQQEERIQQLLDISTHIDALGTEVLHQLRPQDDRFTGHYEYWRAKRITAIVEHYGEKWFQGRKILELGCGHGDIGYVLMSLGANVVFAEGRKDNCEYLRRKFPNNDIYCMNCENEWPFPVDAHFDLVLHMGLLYHLDNLWFALDRACVCCDHMVLETEVADSDDENYILKIEEPADFWDQSLIGRGSRPSPTYVEKHLQDLGWDTQRVTDARCNAQFHVYDWPIQNTGTWKVGQRRFWFCEKGGTLSC